MDSIENQQVVEYGRKNAMEEKMFGFVLLYYVSVFISNNRERAI